MDGGFVKKKLRQQHRRFPTVHDVTGLCQAILAKAPLQGWELFRIYFYDAPPFERAGVNPISRVRVNFSGTPQAVQNENLLRDLELQPNFAVRRGSLALGGWKLGNTALQALAAAPRPLNANDLVPDFKQKGVDMRIGLDIAWLSLKRIVDGMVLVTSDSDFIPAMKLARKEGIRLFLETLGHPVFRDLKVHTDIIL